MLELSDIKSSQEELQDYYAQLRAQNVTPAWIGGGISIEPRSEAGPHLWHWRDLRPQAMRAAELVGTQQAERRVLRLTNPNLPGVASNTLVANIQIVMPDEIARAHRHSAAALRLIIEGRGGYTVVNGERVPMYPGARSHPQLVMARPRQRHRCADDLAGRPRYPAGADARGRVLRRVSPGEARLWRGRQRLAVALHDVGDASRPAAAGCRRYRRHWRGDHPRIHESAYWRTGDADYRLPYAAVA